MPESGYIFLTALVIPILVIWAFFKSLAFLGKSIPESEKSRMAPLVNATVPESPTRAPARSAGASPAGAEASSLSDRVMHGLFAAYINGQISEEQFSDAMRAAHPDEPAEAHAAFLETMRGLRREAERRG